MPTNRFDVKYKLTVLNIELIFPWLSKIRIYKLTNHIELSPYDVMSEGLLQVLCAEHMSRLETYMYARVKDMDYDQEALEQSIMITNEKLSTFDLDEVISWVQIHVRPSNPNIFITSMQAMLKFGYKVKHNAEKYDTINFEAIHSAVLTYIRDFKIVFEFLGADNDRNVPSLHTRDTGLVAIFFEFHSPKIICQSVAPRSYEYDSEY